MSDHVDGNTPNPQLGSDEYRQFTSTLLSVKTQLEHLAARMDAAEERAAEERAAANDGRAAANDIRISAMFKNLDRRAENATRYRYFKSPEVALLKLINLRTGDEIVGFPASVTELSQLDEATARNILDALQIDHQNRDSAGVLELLRYYAYYA